MILVLSVLLGMTVGPAIVLWLEVRSLRSTVAGLEACVARLAAWKDDAVHVLGRWNTLADQVIPPGTNLGRSKVDVVAELLNQKPTNEGNQP